MREMRIENSLITDDSECFVIAEIGHNHQGSLDRCMKLFRAAKGCGADAIKLQKRDNRSLFTREMYDQPYHSENAFGPTYGSHREALEFGCEEYFELRAYARELDITFFATPFDFASVDFLEKLDMPAYKTASADLRNTPLLKRVAEVGKPMIVSTGGSTLDDVKRAYETIMPINSQLAILQCTSNYPVEPEDMNLSVIPAYRKLFPDVTVGLSDHQNGIAMAPVAYALGARIVEKHFTLNRAWKGTDHAFSLEPIGLQKMIRDLRRVRIALGDGVKRIYADEEAPILKMAKKLVAARGLPSGHCMTRDDVAIKSPGDGLPPYELDRILGSVTRRPLRADEEITFDALVERQ